MRIINCYIQNFGTLSEKKFDFTEGLNIIREDNGFGKSTLLSFITAMLYGLPDTKKTKITENERRRYTPWQGGAFGGYMTVSIDGKTYRIERSFGKRASDDTLSVFEIETGKSVSFPSEVGDYAQNVRTPRGLVE